MVRKMPLFLGLILLTCHEGHGMELVKSFNAFKEEVRIRAAYYRPYVDASVLVAATMVVPDAFTSLAATGSCVYLAYAWKKRFDAIARLQEKYAFDTRPVDHWGDNSKKTTFLFGRWRRDNAYGDGIFWPSAEAMRFNLDLVKQTFLYDLYGGRIMKGCPGKLSDIPTAQEVITRLLWELQELERDKHMLKKYTDIYRRFDAPSDFVPQEGIAHVIWFNYDTASQLYIDMVDMIHRIEVLREIIGTLMSSVGGSGWPASISLSR